MSIATQSPLLTCSSPSLVCPAGFVSCTCTYPLDLARACLAVERHAPDTPHHHTKNHSVYYILRKAYQEGVSHTHTCPHDCTHRAQRECAAVLSFSDS